MKYYLSALLIVISISIKAQTIDYAARISADVKDNPASVTLTWEMSDVATGTIYIYRKAIGATSWGSSIAKLSYTDTTYTDNNVSSGNAYEYKIEKSGGKSPVGYIYVGIKSTPIHNRGALLLLVDSTFSILNQNEIGTLIEDISADGWIVYRKDFARNTPLSTIKNHIISTSQSSGKLEAVYILGHLAVPRSGELYPDGHTNHQGAWSADTYYGDLNGTWTDATVNNTSSAYPALHNTPGDGKFDQSALPSTLELQVGRIDFFDMPAAGRTEAAMMKTYLDKAHDFKIGTLQITKRGLIDDNFKSYTEGFAATGWRNFSALTGKDNVQEKDFLTTLNTDSYLWAFGCGGGTYTSAGGIGNVNTVTAADLKTIFVFMFGSYFGDWDYKNSFLRSPLCAVEPALVSIWSGRPHYYMHHMALGYNIGYSVRLSQNNSTVYAPAGYFAGGVHTALLGDPTLLNEYIKPASGLNITADSTAGAILNWTASTEPGVAGYYIYRSTDQYGEYTLRSDMITGTSFIDSFGINGHYWYMVRAAKLMNTPSGTYYSLSLGNRDDENIIYPKFETGVIKHPPVIDHLTVYPNPVKNTLQLSFNSLKNTHANISIYNLHGAIVYKDVVDVYSGNNQKKINLRNYAEGMYILTLTSGSDIKTTTFIIKD